MPVNSNLVWSLVQMLGVSGPAPTTLFGKPVIFSEKNSALGSKGDVILCAPSQYAIGLPQEIILDRSNSPGWLQDTMSFRAIVRVDGMGLWNALVTPLSGNTLSWAIALDTT